MSFNFVGNSISFQLYFSDCFLRIFVMRLGLRSESRSVGLNALVTAHLKHWSSFSMLITAFFFTINFGKGL